MLEGGGEGRVRCNTGPRDLEVSSLAIDSSPRTLLQLFYLLVQSHYIL